MRSVKYRTETASGHIKNNSSTKETLSIWVILFVIYSNFNFSHSHYSLMTLRYLKAGTSEFQEVFTSDMNSSSSWNRTPPPQLTKTMQFSSQLGVWGWSTQNLMILVYNMIILSKLGIRDLFHSYLFYISPNPTLFRSGHFLLCDILITTITNIEKKILSQASFFINIFPTFLPSCQVILSSFLTFLIILSWFYLLPKQQQNNWL